MRALAPNSKTFLYEIDSGALIGTAFGPAANLLTYATFLPDRNELIAFGDKGSLRRWDLDPGSWVRRACAIAGRDVTDKEWEQLLPRRPYQPTCPG